MNGQRAGIHKDVDGLLNPHESDMFYWVTWQNITLTGEKPLF